MKEHGVAESKIERMIQSAIDDIETTFVAVVLEFDHVNMRATVQALSNDYNSALKEFVSQEPILNVPVSLMKVRDFYIRLPYKVGDVVLCSCNKYALDDLLVTGQQINSDYADLGKFEKTDAIVVNSLLIEDETPLTSGNADDLVIHNRRTGDRFVMKDGGGVKIVADVEIQGKLTVSETIDAGDTIHSDVDVTGASVSLENHTHTYTHNSTDDRTTRPANY